MPLGFICREVSPVKPFAPTTGRGRNVLRSIRRAMAGMFRSPPGLAADHQAHRDRVAAERKEMVDRIYD
jgi:hypothetical protein